MGLGRLAYYLLAILNLIRLNCDARAESFCGLSGFAAAGRAAVCAAGAAACAVAGHEASFAAGCEEGYPPLGSIAVALRAFDRRIGVLHGAQGVEMMVAVRTNILIYRHRDQNPGFRLLQS